MQQFLVRIRVEIERSVQDHMQRIRIEVLKHQPFATNPDKSKNHKLQIISANCLSISIKKKTMMTKLRTIGTVFPISE